jgi:hypothetical protein
MRTVVIILLLFISSFTFAQTSFLTNAASKLDKALIEKDTVVLKQLLHAQATYGHSNGWVEKKEDVIRDLVTGKLAYKSIENKEVQWTTAKDWATMRCTSNVQYVLDGKEGALKLHVLQVWMKTGKGWQLISRQSAKL